MENGILETDACNFVANMAGTAAHSHNTQHYARVPIATVPYQGRKFFQNERYFLNLLFNDAVSKTGKGFLVLN
jgi:hypothetical protein